MAKLRTTILILVIQALSLISAESSEGTEQSPQCSQSPKLTGPFHKLVGNMVDQVS